MSVISVTFRVGRQCTSSNAHGGTDQSSCKVLQRLMGSGSAPAARLSASQLALLASLLQLAVAFGVYLCLSAREHVVWPYVADHAVQPDIVIAVHIMLDQAFCIFQCQRRPRGNNRITTVKEQSGSKGYATGFQGLISYVNDQLPTNEQIGTALRTAVRVYPELAIRRACRECHHSSGFEHARGWPHGGDFF